MRSRQILQDVWVDPYEQKMLKRFSASVDWTKTLITSCISIDMVENIMDAKKSVEREHQHHGRKLRYWWEKVVAV